MKDESYWKYENNGNVKPELINRMGRSATNSIFIASTSPAVTIATCEWIIQKQKVTIEEIKAAGFR